MRIQAPPNLVSREECLALIGAGVDDWGGVSPLTPDHVNPERPWPALDELAAVTAEAGLRPGAAADRPAAVRAGRRGVDRPAGAGARRRAGRPRDRLGARRQPGRPAVAGTRRGGESLGRIDLHTAIDTDGRLTETRSDLDSAFGDWESIRETGPRAGGPRPRTHRHRRARGAALGRTRPGRLQRRRVSGAGHRGRPGAGCRCRAGGFAAPRHRRRRRHLRGQPQHQLHQHLLHRLPVLRVRPAQGRRRRVLAVDRRGRRPRVGGARRRRHRGLHAGRHRPRAAGHRLRRSGARGQGAGAVDARARVLADGDRQRRDQERAVASGSG